MRNTLFLVSFLGLYFITGIPCLRAQPKTVPFSLEDLRQWRDHSVTLSDDGQWYTVRYSLVDEPDEEKDSLSPGVEKIQAYFGELNQTDVLYIHHATKGMQYQVPDGQNPVFSDASDWVAYQVATEKEEEETFIELRHLASGYTVRYESSARYRFLEGKNYFLTTDANSILIYDLEHRTEHFIGNIGEFLTDKESPFVVYTIASEDKRGNGIYLYDPAKRTTQALETGNYVFSNLAWNSNHTALASYRYKKDEEPVDSTMQLVIHSGVGTELQGTTYYPVPEMAGMPENLKLTTAAGPLVWSNDDTRLFLMLKKDVSEDDNEEKGAPSTEDVPTVQVWHWRDKKLLSERIMEYERTQNTIYSAIFFRETNSLIQVTSEAVQTLFMSKGTDRWALGRDNREYISDWDVNQHDLYRINLETGDQKLIREAYRSQWGSGIEISPDGEKVVLWDGAHFLCYEFESDEFKNITEGLPVSFVNLEHDLPGFTPSYGFVGWVKDQNAVILNHKLDLWWVPLQGGTPARNLTGAGGTNESIRFRWEDRRFASEEAIEDRYLDLSKQQYLNAFDIETKYSGFYSLQNGQLKEVIFGAYSVGGAWRRSDILKSDQSDALIYVKGDYQQYPEAYLTNANFRSPKKITDTNPQQERFAWGKRILIEYTNDDGVPLKGILSIPNSYRRGQKLPMVVYSYEKRSSLMYHYSVPYMSGAGVSEMLYVSDGYLFLQPDIHFNIGTPHSDMHECINAAIEKVMELGYVDEERIGYEGFSFGGHCGMYMSTQENKFAAIAAGAGVSNLVQGFNIDIVRDGSNEQDYYMSGQGRLGTDPTANTEMYISESPVFNASTMNTPLLLFHGTADKVVQWEHSFGFYSILRYLQKPVVFLSYRGEGHGLRQEINRLDIQTRLKAYFDHYLKGAEMQPWMEEGVPYVPSAGDTDSGSLPKWK